MTTPEAERPWIVICPRECPDPRTEHCLGPLINGRARCRFCHRFMPLGEVFDVGYED